MTQGLFSRIRALGITAGLGLAALLCVAPGQAAAAATGAAPASALSQPFAQWGDANQYKLAPGGSFEDTTTGWTLSGGAATVAGSEPYGATGSVGASVARPARRRLGTVAVHVRRPAIPDVPAVRDAARLLDRARAGRLPGAARGAARIPVGTLSPEQRLGADLADAHRLVLPAVLGGGTAQVALRFTALTGDSQIDDVFIDPRLHH